MDREKVESRQAGRSQVPSVADSRFKFIPLAGQAGKERDSETNLDYFGARYYSWRGQWLQVDPLRDKYAGWSGYNYVEDNPINLVDTDGRKVIFGPHVSEEFKNEFKLAVNYLNEHGMGGYLSSLEKSKTTYIITFGKENDQFDSGTKTITWDPNEGIYTTNGHALSPSTALNHEADHANEFDKNPTRYHKDTKTSDANYDNKEEKRVITGSEQKTAKVLGEIKDGEVTRTDHRGQPFRTTSPTSTNDANAVISTPQ